MAEFADTGYKYKTELAFGFFYVTVKPTRLPLGMLSDTAFYVGVKVVLKDERELAIYVSKEKTRSYTDLHLQDEKIAKRIKRKIDRIIKENNEVN